MSLSIRPRESSGKPSESTGRDAPRFPPVTSGWSANRKFRSVISVLPVTRPKCRFIGTDFVASNKPLERESVHRMLIDAGSLANSKAAASLL